MINQSILIKTVLRRQQCRQQIQPKRGCIKICRGFYADFGQQLPSVQKQIIVHIIEDVSFGGFIADGIDVIEKLPDFFEDKSVGFASGGDAVHWTSLSGGYKSEKSGNIVTKSPTYFDALVKISLLKKYA
jgi:hypothetical protein